MHDATRLILPDPWGLCSGADVVPVDFGRLGPCAYGRERAGGAYGFSSKPATSPGVRPYPFTTAAL